MNSALDPERIVVTEIVDSHPVGFMSLETWDGLYAPIGLRKPEGDGPFPMVLMASGNGGEGIGYIRNAVRDRGQIMDQLVGAGYACAWIRYRTEVELGYNNGGALVRDVRRRDDRCLARGRVPGSVYRWRTRADRAALKW